MRLIGCDLHASQQSIAMWDRDTGAVIEKTLTHEGETVREFYASIPPPVLVGIEATGSGGFSQRRFFLPPRKSPPCWTTEAKK